MYLEQLCHFSSLLFRFCRVFLLDHAESGYGEFELDFEFVLVLLGGLFGGCGGWDVRRGWMRVAPL